MGKVIKTSGLIDTRKYDDFFLLAKILLEMDLTEEERTTLMKHFEKEINE